MSEELHRFPPTELKLEKLREAGIVPFSEDVMCFAVFLGTGVGIWLCAVSCMKQIAGLFEHLWAARYDEAALAGELVKSSVAEHFAKTGQAVFLMTLAFVVPLVCLVLLTGGLQTRFLFSLNRLSLDFGRFFRFGGWIWQGLFTRFFFGFTRLIKVLCWIVVSAMILGYLITEKLPFAPVESAKIVGQAAPAGDGKERGGAVSPLFADSAGEARLSEAIDEIGSVWFCLLAFSFFVGILSRFVTVLRFYQSHRMTRSELEAEYRETEQAPQFKGMQREILSGPDRAGEQ